MSKDTIDKEKLEKETEKEAGFEPKISVPDAASFDEFDDALNDR